MSLGENNERTINLIINLGYAYLKIEDYGLAIENLQKGLDKKQKLLKVD